MVDENSLTEAIRRLYVNMCAVSRGWADFIIELKKREVDPELIAWAEKYFLDAVTALDSSLVEIDQLINPQTQQDEQDSFKLPVYNPATTSLHTLN